MKTLSVRETAEAAKRASRTLASLTGTQRNAALEAMAVALQQALPELLKANAKDIAVAAELLASGELSSATVQRLKLDESKLDEMVQQVRAVAALPDPLGRKLEAIEMDDADPGLANGVAANGLHMQKVSVPLGVLAVIFEARPDAVTQIAALALKSGNAAILKPGREVEHTAEALVYVLRSTLVAQELPEDSVSLVTGREQVKELLGETSLVDMVIPRGSKALVEYVQANTRIPVLGHSEGVCHIYVDRDVDEAMALRVIEDAKCDYPAACNAVETVLVHQDIAETFLPKLAKHLRKCGVTIHADALAAKPMGGVNPSDDWTSSARSLTAHANTSSKTSGGVNPSDQWIGSDRSLTVDDEPAACKPVGDWHTEYGDLAVSVGVVESMDAAIDHIHTHGSSHTETIMTEDAAAAARFLREVDAAAVLHNASTRFADGFRFGFGAEVGISTSKFHARGPVGLEGLTTYKYVVRGRGHVAGDYRGKNARAFTHRKESVA